MVTSLLNIKSPYGVFVYLLSLPIAASNAIDKYLVLCSFVTDLTGHVT